MLGATRNLASQSQLKKEIEKMIDYDSSIEFKKTPGFIVHIIDGENIYTEDFGTKTINSKDTLTAQDNFQIGSLSKVFTSLLIHELAKEKIVSLEDEIHTYLDPSIENEKMLGLTIQDLLLHATNFPKTPNNFGKKEKDISNPYAYYTKDDLFAFYASYKKDQKKDKKIKASYSHINYALLEVIAEQATQTSYEDLLQQYIFLPCQMENSGISFSDTTLTPGYRKTRKSSTYWTFASFAASLGVYSNAQDLGILLNNYFNNEEFALRESMDAMASLSIPTIYNDKFHSGLGWQVIKGQTPYDIYAMSGTTDGHNAFMAMIRETKTAVIILANSAVGTEDLGMQVLRMINNNWKRKGADEPK